MFVVGNWEGQGKWKMWFTHGGAIEFGRAMLDAGRMGEHNNLNKKNAICMFCIIYCFSFYSFNQ